MAKNSKLTGALAALIVIAFAISPATAQISATGTVTAVPSGDNYLYTISLQNTGTTNIDTFWFSWLPDNYDFLPSVPTPTGAPANWTSFVETGYYGSSIQYYDTANSPITHGQTNSSFQFLSPDAPDALQASNYYFGLPTTYSYVYAGPPSGPGADPVAAGAVIFSMPVALSTVPEPSGFVPVIIGAAMCLFSWRRAN